MHSPAPRPVVFVLHLHQPAENLGQVYDEAYLRCYEPLLAALSEHEPIKVGLHCSGALLEWVKTARPQMLQSLQALVDRGQVELLGGGFYEPILSALPDSDAIGQLEMMARFLERYFGQRPEGVWLAERVWDPDLPRVLSACGVRYTLLDDAVFRGAGLLHRPLTGYYHTERAGAPLAVFPIDKSLRYRVPSSAPEELVQALSVAGPGSWNYGDDAEKFGLWPGSYGWVYEERWLSRFFAAMTEAQEAGHLCTWLPGEYLDHHRPSGQVYLPGGAYEELMEWALPMDAARELSALKSGVDAQRFSGMIRGAPWQAFLRKYPEAAALYRKMLYVSTRLQSAMEDQSQGSLQGDVADELGTAQRALYRGQGADPYWHGVFAGVYSPHLRERAFAALVEAERRLDTITLGDADWLSHEQEDLDLDGREEVLLSNRYLNAYVRPHDGGSVFELDDKMRGANLTHVMARRPEPYHPEGECLYDAQRRVAFRDRVFEPGADLMQARWPQTIDRAALDDYELSAVDVREGQDLCFLTMRCEAPVDGAEEGRIEVRKRFELPIDKPQLNLRYTLSAEQKIELVFATEINLSLPPGGLMQLEHDRIDPAEAGMIEAFSGGVLECPSWKLRISVVGLSSMVRFPIETLSRGQLGLETLYQGSALVIAWPVSITPERPVELGLSLEML